jgi:LuxR family maltose regulon positive regulatory protein
LKRGYQRRIIEILALKALALQQMGEVEPALLTLEKALSLAEPEGYQRTFVDEGEPMARLLYQAVAHKIHPVYSGRLLEVLSEESQRFKPSEKRLIEGLIDPPASELEILGRSGASNAGDSRAAVSPEHCQRAYNQHL